MNADHKPTVLVVDDDKNTRDGLERALRRTCTIHVADSAERALEHFDRVVGVTRGRKASPYVSLASSVAVRKQDYKMFEDLLNKALAIDPDTMPEWRLANTLAQEKAQWLLDNSAGLFLDCEETDP